MLKAADGPYWACSLGWYFCVAPGNCLIYGETPHTVLQMNLLTTASVSHSGSNSNLYPAMNQQMWAASATTENLAKKLQSRGVMQMVPRVAKQSLSWYRLWSYGFSLRICYLYCWYLPRQAKCNADSVCRFKKIMITADQTREALDPVRYISNHSQGENGYANSACLLSAKWAQTSLSCRSGKHPSTCKCLSWVSVPVHKKFARCRDGAIFQQQHLYCFVLPLPIFNFPRFPKHKVKKEDGVSERFHSEAKTLIFLKRLQRKLNPPFTLGLPQETNDVEAHGKKQTWAQEN